MNETRRPPEDLPHDRPSPARMYDYFLGGYHNFEIDRLAARQVLKITPDTPLIMQTNRAFLRRVVNFLAAQGIEQFLDLGSGIPTVGNVHEVARRSNPSARVVYVDVEPVAVRHGEAILADDPNTAVIQADLRRPEEILAHPTVRDLLDLDRPMAVLILSVLQFVGDEAYDAVRRLREALQPGGYLAISHATRDGIPDEPVERLKQVYDRTGTAIQLRPHDRVLEFFEGLEMVEPGLVHAPLWRPEGEEDLFLERPELSVIYGGVGRKP